VKKWLCLLIGILMLIVGCAQLFEPPPYREDAAEYWKKVLYHKTSETQSRDEERAPKGKPPTSATESTDEEGAPKGKPPTGSGTSIFGTTLPSR